MKETHIFYAPQLPVGACELPDEEAAHALRVLRMKEGDTLMLTNGKGLFFEAHITLASRSKCLFAIDRTIPDKKLWKGGIHIAVAPTKNMDRMEWLTEKATEIGMDSLSLLNCKNSERRIVKTERLNKIAISAMKQSHKAYLPYIQPITSFEQFISQDLKGQKFIAHCYSPDEVKKEEGITHLTDRNFLGDLLQPESSTYVLIGPEGDFSIDEVKKAINYGFQPISLGKSRLRTETAALVAVHLMYLAKRVKG